MLNKLRRLLSRKSGCTLSEADLRWNQFIQTVCMGDGDDLSPVQRNAFLCFWYDAEVNNGGHGQYFDLHPHVAPEEAAAAIRAVAASAIAENLLKAALEGERDDYRAADAAYRSFDPPLIDCLQAYVERNHVEILQ